MAGKLLPATVRVDAIFSGEISGCGCSLKRTNFWSEFPVNREFNREKLKFGLFRTVFKDFTRIYFTKTTSKGHFPVIKITGKKKFSSGKEIIKTGKRGSRIGKFKSVKIKDDFEKKSSVWKATIPN